MANYTIFWMFENPTIGRQARNFTTNVPKILDLKSSSEQIFFRKLSLGAPEKKTERGQYPPILIKIKIKYVQLKDFIMKGTNMQIPKYTLPTQVTNQTLGFTSPLPSHPHPNN